jgi:DNA-binding GntR family transcriptional regulator
MTAEEGSVEPTRARRGKRPAPGLQAVTRQTLADSVYVELRTAIARGDLADGTELKQLELAEKLGVSRVPVREALRRLQAEHLVQGNPFHRFAVTSLTTEQVIELIDLREELEVFALKRAVHSDSLSNRLSEARKVASTMQLNQDPEQWIEADREFHRVLNGRVTAVATLIEDLRERVHRYVHSAVPDSVVKDANRRREVLREHEAVLAALDAGDEGAAEAAIRDHVAGTRRFHGDHVVRGADGGLADAASSETAKALATQS